jgi:serine/threonine protein kinase
MSDFPRRFGAYVLLKPLARGGMGALYLALSSDKDDARLCVIKTVLPHLADKEYLARFRDEAKVVVRLSHENLVPVFDSGQVEGEIYLAMDFVDGKDLRATWNRCAKKGIAFPIDVAAYIIKELARGLHHAHTFGGLKLVHRDVSPPNVLLSYGGEVRLTDFGLASSTLKLEKTAPGIIYGKVSYMSPEQARGETVDGRTDLYASGIILWELLTGRQLFPAAKNQDREARPAGQKDLPTTEEVLRRVRNPEIVGPSRRASRVPPELDRIALKALAPELGKRYQTCEELRLDLTSYLAQASPPTDADRIVTFLKELFGPDIEHERSERDRLIEETRAALAAPGGIKTGRPGKGGIPAGLPKPSVVSLPPPLKLPTVVSPPPPPSAALRPASSTSQAPSSSTRATRAEKGTVVAGPARHDHSLDKSLALTDSQVESSLDLREDTEALSAAVVGTVVGGRYLVRRLCGEGGMGRVYEAEHIEIGKRVALKILHPAYSQTPDLVERLKREARAASKIAHANVVDVTDSGTTPDGAFFFVMEYIEGIELGELIHREGKLAVPRALAITAQVCRALQAAHAVNVIHRDLKPENVLILARDGQKDFVKVLDFGIAKSGGQDDDEKDSRGHLPRRLTHPGMTMGTPEYMAPEQAAGRPADPRSDIYALGGVLYEMLTGQPPYEGSNFMEILHKKANQLPAPLTSFRSDVPAEVAALITRSMAKDPAGRPQTMEELEREIQHLASTWFPIGADGQREPSAPQNVRPLAGMRGAGESFLPRLWDRARRWEKKKVAIVSGSVLGLLLAFVIAGSTKRDVRVPPAASGPPPGVVARPSPAPAPAAAPVTEEKGEGEKAAAAKEAEEKSGEREEDDGSGRSAVGAIRSKAAPLALVDNRKLLEEGERFLRAERFSEAREIFTKLTRSRRERGSALVGLAEISFQEKNYAAAVKSAQLAAERGGGVRARVLLGDAHFRLHQYQEAAKAYEDALKVDPNNASARSGLALANKRM